MLSVSETSLLFSKQRFFDFFKSLVQSVRISPILAKMTISKDVSPTAQHDKVEADVTLSLNMTSKAAQHDKKQTKLFKIATGLKLK